MKKEFSNEDLQSVKEHLVYMPYVKVSFGAFDKETIFMNLSFEKRENWANGIYQNSNNIILRFDSNGVIETVNTSLYEKGQFASYENRLNKKFRKTTVKSMDEFFKKIDKYLLDVLNYYNN